MGKAKTSGKRKTSSRKLKNYKIEDFKGIKKVNPLDYLTNEENVGLAILECLQNNDPEGVMEAIGIYIERDSKIGIWAAPKPRGSTIAKGLVLSSIQTLLRSNRGSFRIIPNANFSGFFGTAKFVSSFAGKAA